jgi:hypothetical protein
MPETCVDFTGVSAAYTDAATATKETPVTLST